MARNKIVAIYDYYTLEQAREILAEEIKQEYKRKIAQKRRKERVYYLKQKCIGSMLIIATCSIYIVCNDMLTCLPFFSLGVACFSKLHLIYD